MEKYVTSNNMAMALLFILGVCYCFNLIYSTVVNAGKIKAQNEAPITDLDRRVKYLEDEIRAYKTRFKMYEENVEQIQNQDRILMKSVKALLNHGIHNGNTDEMEKAASEIDEFLMQK